MPKGNPQAYSRMAKTLASRGRHGDTMLAHINPQEAQVLKNMGGSGTINPDTGLPEYFAVTGALIAGGLAAAGSAYSASQKADAAESRAQAQRQARGEALDVQRDRLAASLANRTDAFGNRLIYDEGDPNKRGDESFRVEPTTQTQRILDTQQEGQLQRLREDLERTQRGAEQGELAQPIATAELRELAGPDEYTPEGIRGLLTEQAMIGVNDAFEGAQEGAARQIMRTGGDPRRNTFSDLAEERADANREARVDAQVRALGLAPELNAASDDRNRSNLSTASNIAVQGVAPQAQPSIGGQLSRSLAARQPSTGASFGGVAQAAGVAPAVADTSGATANMFGAAEGLATEFFRANGGMNEPLFGTSRTRSASGNTTSGPLSSVGGVGGATPRRF